MATMRAVELSGGFGLENLRLVERPKPAPGPGEVLVRMKAATLNYRDWLLVEGSYNPKQTLPLVPLSDGAGVVESVGAGVRAWKPGDRAVASFFQGWLGGEPTREALQSSLGGWTDGVLAEYRVFAEAGLLPVPPHLEDAEAAALPCAGLTAWSAVVTLGGVRPGDVVLVQGTGGVALFALQFARLAGAEVIVTSSSDAKLRRARELGAGHAINYRAEPEWGRVARDITGGRGVDLVVEVGGAGTLMQSIRATRVGGTIAMIGVLSSAEPGDLRLPLVVMQQLRLQGVTVGSRQGFEAMLRAVAASGLRPVMDRRFRVEDVRAAYEHLAAAAHMGKVAIAI